MAIGNVGRRVVVTGGCGFIGREVARAFHNEGASVLVVDRKQCDQDEVESIKGDLCDRAIREEAIKGDTDVVVHLAARTSVVASRGRPHDTYDMNVCVTGELLELARKRGVKRFILASSAAAVGECRGATMSEGTALSPVSPYGASKAAGEMLLAGYRGLAGLSTCSLRLTNVYGGKMEGKDSLVARIMRAAVRGDVVHVYGDGSQVRDFVHVSDVVRAVVLLAGIDYGPCVVIGCGHSRSVLGVIETLRLVSGAEIPVTHRRRRPGEAVEVRVDIRRAQKLGYEPRWSVEAGLAASWREFVVDRKDRGVRSGRLSEIE